MLTKKRNRHKRTPEEKALSEHRRLEGMRRYGKKFRNVQRGIRLYKLLAERRKPRAFFAVRTLSDLEEIDRAIYIIRLRRVCFKIKQMKRPCLKVWRLQNENTI